LDVGIAKIRDYSFPAPFISPADTSFAYESRANIPPNVNNETDTTLGDTPVSAGIATNDSDPDGTVSYNTAPVSVLEH
jgi:hypothetical protein